MSWRCGSGWGWLQVSPCSQMCLFLREGWGHEGRPGLILPAWYRVTLGMFSLAEEPPWLGEFSASPSGGKGCTVCVWPRQMLQGKHHVQRGENCSGGKLSGGVLRRRMAFQLLWHYDVFLLLFACRVAILRTLRWSQRTLFPLLKWLAWLQPLWWKWTLSERTVRRGQWVFWLLFTGGTVSSTAPQIIRPGKNNRLSFCLFFFSKLSCRSSLKLSRYFLCCCNYGVFI